MWYKLYVLKHLQQQFFLVVVGEGLGICVVYMVAMGFEYEWEM